MLLLLLNKDAHFLVQLISTRLRVHTKGGGGSVSNKACLIVAWCGVFICALSLSLFRFNLEQYSRDWPGIQKVASFIYCSLGSDDLIDRA